MTQPPTRRATRRPAPRPLHDQLPDVRLQLSGLWVATMFVFAYVDIFGFFRADVLRGALDGEIAGQDIAINQTFLVVATVFVTIPTLMIVASLLLPARPARALNVTVGTVYAVAIAVLCIGESWAYYLLGSAVEVALLALVVRTAWRWPWAGVLEEAERSGAV